MAHCTRGSLAFTVHSLLHSYPVLTMVSRTQRFPIDGLCAVQALAVLVLLALTTDRWAWSSTVACSPQLAVSSALEYEVCSTFVHKIFFRGDGPHNLVIFDRNTSSTLRRLFFESNNNALVVDGLLSMPCFALNSNSATAAADASHQRRFPRTTTINQTSDVLQQQQQQQQQPPLDPLIDGQLPCSDIY
jgi:hypothetical protein